MRTHTLLGEQMLGGVAFLRGEGLRIVRSHHERWDGRGYPDGIAGTDIPLAARIFAVADALDAMTSDRPYRPALSWATAGTRGRRASPRRSSTRRRAGVRRARGRAAGSFAPSSPPRQPLHPFESPWRCGRADQVTMRRVALLRDPSAGDSRARGLRGRRRPARAGAPRPVEPGARPRSTRTASRDG